MASRNISSISPVKTDRDKDFTIREYQQEIIDLAIKNNVIVFLPTGSGKTFIAIKLIEHYLNKISKKYSQGGERVFFLVNTTPLVNQQADAIEKLLPIKVGKYTGDRGVDMWKGDRWEEEQDENNVLVMTAQIYLDMICHCYTDLNKSCLLIFDECHHSVGKHPMRQIMTEVKKRSVENRPKILGLTAVLINSNLTPAKVLTEVEALEVTLDAKVVRAVNHEMVLQYSTNPTEKLLEYYEDDCTLPFHKLIDEFIVKVNNYLNILKLPSDIIIDEEPPNAVLLNDTKDKSLSRVVNTLNDTAKISKELGLFAADVCLLSLVITIERFKLSSDETVMRILSCIETGIHFLRKKLILTYGNVEPKDKPLFHATDKVMKLKMLLQDLSEEHNSIIFVDRRSTAHSLNQIFKELSKHDPNFKHIHSEYVVGVNRASERITRENEFKSGKNTKVLQKFNKGEINVLFASNVIEEGVDIRRCNFVVKFDIPITFTSYIQSKGRARHVNSTYIVISPKNSKSSRDFKEYFEKYNLIEQTLNNFLCDHHRDKAEDSNDDDTDDNYSIENVYGAKVTALSAISLINRYCSLLPHDKFLKHTCLWWAKKVVLQGKNMIICFLKLPINSPIRTIIEGIPRDSLESAKRLVALKACKMLNDLGEFDSRFIPFGSKSDLLNDVKIFPNWKEELLKFKGKYNLINVYDKHYSKWECNCKPTTDSDVFMHVIKVNPDYSYPDTDRLQAFYNLLLFDSTFCILSTSSWPELPAFPLFMNVGPVKIEVLVNSSFVSLTTEEISKLEDFQTLLFSDAITILKEGCVIDPDETVDNYMIAPVNFINGSYEIDWDTINNEKRFPEIIPKPNGRIRLEQPVTEERYNMKVVVPWYRPENYRLKYVVTKVRLDKTPETPFPNEIHKSFFDYYFNQYSIEIYDKSQPLLEVRAISSKINCLTPRAEYNNARRKKKENEGYEETLIPELTYLLTFPAWYFVKVCLLPSALHRVHHFLVAEELRQTIVSETKMGTLELPGCTKWKELKVTSSCVMEVEVDAPSNQEHKGYDCTSHTSVANDGENMSESNEVEPVDIDRCMDVVDISSLIQYCNYVDTSLVVTKVAKNTEKVFCHQIDKSKVVKPLKTITGTYKGYGPELVDILEVLTAASAHDIINYERAELLGDSFLKFAASLALFTFYPLLDEGKLTQVKGKIIGNTNLFFCGLAKNLPSMLKVFSFDYNDWKVPGFSINRKSEKMDVLTLTKRSNEGANDSPQPPMPSLNTLCIMEETDSQDNSDNEDSSDFRKVGSKNEYLMKHHVHNKVVSDCVEALTCVFLQNFGVQGGFKILNWLGVIPDSIGCIDTLLYSETESPLINDSFTFEYLIPNQSLLESNLGYNFKNRAFLLQALTHSSHSHNFTDCYQRYEFLGDSILDFLLTAYLFEEYQHFDPGMLTDLRSALVNNVTFACITVRHRFHCHLLHKGSKLTEAITKFVTLQESRNHEISQEVFCLIEESEVQVAECQDVPKALGDLFESLIAAVYLDSGKDLNQVWTVIYRIMKNEINNFAKKIPKNAVRLLFEKFTKITPVFGKSETRGDMVMIPVEVCHQGKSKIFYGFGGTKYFAKIAAAKIALKYFKK